MIIGMSGFARAGKDEIAKVLVRDHGFVRVAFADKLRDFLYALNPICNVHGYNNINWVVGQGVLYVQDIIDKYGWDGYKETVYGPEIRRLLQRLGTEAGRQVMWDTIWIDAALTGFDPDANIVVSDARFFNEFDAIRERGGEIWRVERPGVGPANDHASEMEAIDYPHFKYTIQNDGTLEDLPKWVGALMSNRSHEKQDRGGVVTFDMTRGN